VTSVINRYYDPTTGSFVSVDPDVAATGQAYAYAGDDPVNNVDPSGLCNSGVANGYYPGACATTGAEAMQAEAYIQGHAQGGWSWSGAFEAEADYGAGIANFATSTVTFGRVHVSDPYCGYGWASDVGFGYGAIATLILGGGEAEGASDASIAESTGSNSIPDETVLVRGGTNSAEQLANGSGVTVNSDGTLQGVSVNSGDTVEGAAQGIPHKQIGVTTAGEVRAAGGTVESDPLANNSGHCLIGGIDTGTLSGLLTPTIKNPGC
jgi:hypothetical protein